MSLHQSRAPINVFTPAPVSAHTPTGAEIEAGVSIAILIRIGISMGRGTFRCNRTDRSGHDPENLAKAEPTVSSSKLQDIPLYRQEIDSTQRVLRAPARHIQTRAIVKQLLAAAQLDHALGRIAKSEEHTS